MSLTVDGFEGMIAGSLGIEEPWYISKCMVDSSDQTMHIYPKSRLICTQNEFCVLRTQKKVFPSPKHGKNGLETNNRGDFS